MRNKKAAIEMSIGTVIILVLGVSMLILGMILIKNIMCSGISIGNDLSTGVKNEIKNLFGADKIGVKCLGESGKKVELGTGSTMPVICIIKTDEANAKYTIKVPSIESLTTSVSDATVNSWVKDKNWTGTVQPGTDNEVVILLFDIPKQAPRTSLKLGIEVTDSVGNLENKVSYIEIVPTGFIKGAIC